MNVYDKASQIFHDLIPNVAWEGTGSNYCSRVDQYLLHYVWFHPVVLLGVSEGEELRLVQEPVLVAVRGKEQEPGVK